MDLPMHIVMLSDYETQYGAAISASRLAEALCQQQYRVTRIVGEWDRAEHPWATVRLWPSLFVWGMCHVMAHDPWLEFSAWSLGRQLHSILDDLQPDVINIHNLHGMMWTGWSLDLVRACAEHAPTVWTLHDMWSLTGRCAYSYDCGKFSTGCDAGCPTYGEYPELEPSRIAEAWLQRRELLSHFSQLAAVNPSTWLKRQAQQGLWARHRVEGIPNGLPLDVYCPMDRGRARSELGLPATGPVLIAIATNLAERRKGAALLIEALRRLPPRSMTLITLGAGHLDCDIEGIDVHPLGYVADERTKMLAYNAADLSVHPAPVDNLPNTVMEALACGTPVVGFPIGGVREMVRPGETGWLADDVTGDALARALSNALEQVAGGVDLRKSCRVVAEAEYGADLQADRYVALFRSMLSSEI
jgi:glycosyltransferase involved in cell wall biosynthesis